MGDRLGFTRGMMKTESFLSFRLWASVRPLPGLCRGRILAPRQRVERSLGIVIVPGMKQAAFGVGAKWGRGYAVCRQNHAGWGAPAAIRVEGGSFGFQIGGSNTDIVMLVMNERGMRHLLEDKVTLGAEATVAAGPVGRQDRKSTRLNS